MIFSNDLSSLLLTPTVSTAIYAAGDMIGALTALTTDGAGSPGPVLHRGGSGRIAKAVLYDAGGQIQTHTIRLWLFRDNPTAATLTDQAPVVIPTADQTKVEGFIDFNQASGGQFSSAGVFQVIQQRCEIIYECVLDTLYGAFAAVGTPTFPASTNLSARLWFARD